MEEYVDEVVVGHVLKERKVHVAGIEMKDQTAILVNVKERNDWCRLVGLNLLMKELVIVAMVRSPLVQNWELMADQKHPSQGVQVRLTSFP